ncbi:MAG TPA: hypothetical protein VGC15_20795 [Acetobacteraceae bacterium]
MVVKLTRVLPSWPITALRLMHVLVEAADPDVDTLPMPALAQAGGGFDRLVGEPGLYTDADLVPEAH